MAIYRDGSKLSQPLSSKSDVASRGGEAVETPVAAEIETAP